MEINIFTLSKENIAMQHC